MAIIKLPVSWTIISLKPIQAFSSITLNEGIPADFFKTSFSSYHHDLPIPHRFSNCPQPMYSTKETKWFLEAVSKEKMGAREWVPDVVKLTENCSVQFYVLHVQFCWPAMGHPLLKGFFSPLYCLHWVPHQYFQPSFAEESRDLSER